MKFLFWYIIGFLVLSINSYRINNDYSSLFPGDCGAQVKAVLIDSGITGKDISWLSNPKFLKMKILAIKYSDNDKWRSTYGTTNVYFSKKTKGFKYGELFCLKGYFIKPEKVLISGSFDYRYYLKSNGINRIFICSEYKEEGLRDFPYNVAQTIFLFRDKVLHLLCKGIKDKNIRAFLAGFFLGCRQDINSEIKQNFLRSGTIHILAISGLHIGVLCLILLLLLRPLPISIKFIIIPILLLFYVSLTGFRPSGLRALLMISILCFHRAFFYSFSPINSIAFAAVLILLINPFAIGNVGFQFSFIIAGLLVLSWPKVNKFLSVISEKNKWRVQDKFSNKVWLRNYLNKKVTLLITTSIIAGISGTGLILYYQNLFIPLMFLTNIIVLPLLLPLFLIGFLKVFFSLFWGGFAVLFNYMLNGIVSFILITAETGASVCFADYFEKPSIIFLVIFYILLIILFIAKSNRKVIMSFCMLILIFSFWIFSHIFSAGFISIMQEKGNNQPAIIIKPNSYLDPVIINCSKKLGFIVIEKLKQKGVNNIGYMVLTGSNSKCSGGITYILEKMSVNKVLIPKKLYKNKLYNTIMELCKKKNIPVVFVPDFEKAGETVINLDILNTELNIEITEVNPGNKKITIKFNGEKEKFFYIKNSNQNQIFNSEV